MKEISYSIRGSEVAIYVVETDDDMNHFMDFVRQNEHGLAFDTETTGLGIYGPNYKIRMAQFGHETEAFVIPIEKSARWAYIASQALNRLREVWIQNASFDVQVVEHHWGINVDWKKVVDTKILAHLVDARPKKDGGPGHSLEELTAHYICPDVAAEVKSSMKGMAKDTNTTIDEVWSRVDIDHPTYQLYAGMDVILTARLRRILMSKIPPNARPLIGFEHNLSRVCTAMERRGIRLDHKHTKRQISRFKRAETVATRKCRDLGVDNPNSREQVVEGLRALGVSEFTQTPTGLPSADSNLLKKLSNEKNDAGALAAAIIDAKRAVKWRSTYFDRFMTTADSKGMIHPGIHTLAARTARMSVTNPAVQTLPGKSGVIRDSLLADEGHVWVSVDYDSQELRMAAALSGDQIMWNEFQRPTSEIDLHQITADAAGVDRSVGKMANFLTVYGGGWRALTTQAGVGEEVAKKVIDSFNTTYKGVSKYARQISESAKRKGYVTTATGRRLHVDPSRPYAAINYMIQSSSRDVTARAITQLDRAGFGPYMLMPVHDEIDFTFPADKAEEMARQASEIMTMEHQGIRFTTDVQIGKESWGSLPDFETEFKFDGEGDDID